MYYFHNWAKQKNKIEKAKRKLYKNHVCLYCIHHFEIKTLKTKPSQNHAHEGVSLYILYMVFLIHCNISIRHMCICTPHSNWVSDAVGPFFTQALHTTLQQVMLYKFEATFEARFLVHMSLGDDASMASTNLIPDEAVTWIEAWKRSLDFEERCRENVFLSELYFGDQISYTSRGWPFSTIVIVGQDHWRRGSITTAQEKCSCTALLWDLRAT